LEQFIFNEINMALTPAQLAELQRLKELMRPQAEDFNRRMQGVINMEKTAGQPLRLPTDKKAKGGLEKFLEPSAVKERLYHGTNRDFHMFAPAPSRGATFLTPKPEFANEFIKDFKNNRLGAQQIMPVHVQVKNPFDYEDPQHMRALKGLVNKHMPYLKDVVERIGDHEHNWEAMEDPEIQHFIKHLGHDSFYASERGTKNLGVYDPKKIKSAIGNRGTYDVKNPDITKAKGGRSERAEEDRQGVQAVPCAQRSSRQTVPLVR
jgi:hypothetical protein